MSQTSRLTRFLLIVCFYHYFFSEKINLILLYSLRLTRFLWIVCFSHYFFRKETESRVLLHAWDAFAWSSLSFINFSEKKKWISCSSPRLTHFRLIVRFLHYVFRRKTDYHWLSRLTHFLLIVSFWFFFFFFQKKINITIFFSFDTLSFDRLFLSFFFQKKMILSAISRLETLSPDRLFPSLIFRKTAESTASLSLTHFLLITYWHHFLLDIKSEPTAFSSTHTHSSIVHSQYNWQTHNLTQLVSPHWTHFLYQPLYPSIFSNKEYEIQPPSLPVTYIFLIF